MLLAPDIVEVFSGRTNTPAVPSIVPLPTPVASPPSIVDTPIKLGSSTIMKDKVVGPMPVEEFLPSSQIPNYDALSFTLAFMPHMFSDMLSAVVEENAYRPFMSIPAYVTLRFLTVQI
ncbi:uncharacterized protein BJ212DRAFT_1487268 [Suillus subaureus]|uniref:Uncharacterized protein n=1 Tax=Suillus subaureus TaxID=48587 RepID=A0A9P7DU14_9AGAM|nr:uncharacterized protein BJ212DRAFT_1487268 [Suillus subaureus]KAG1802976.1 hypothetical protein BJ212DRAFT_1487268 [Suillus subaureus]